MPIALLFTTAAATAVGAAALHAVHGLRKQISSLREELAERRTPSAAAAPLVPHARTHTDTEQIRRAVAEALADERERELAEARAFWAAQETRDGVDAPSLLGLPADDLFLPRQSDFVGLDSLAEAAVEFDESVPGQGGHEFSGESAELAAARRRHPSHPDFVPVQSPVSGDHERTVACLEELAEAGTELADVRPGPLGTLDVYVFADGTTLCMTPGHRETAQQLAAALQAGQAPVLLGGSGVSGAYSLTFSCGEANVYVLADRVIASA